MKLFKKPGFIIPLNLLIVSTILLLGFKAFETVKRATLDEFNQRQLILAKGAANSVELFFTVIANNLRHSAHEPMVQQFDEPFIRQELQYAFNALQTMGVNDVAVLDSTGILRYNVTAQTLEGSDFSWREYFQRVKTFSASNHYVLEFVEFKGVDLGKKGIILAVPIVNTAPVNASATEEFLGVVLATIKLDTLTTRLIAPIELSPRGQAVLIDNDSKVLWSPDSFFIGKSPYRIHQGNLAFQQTIGEMWAGDGGTAEYRAPKWDESSGRYTTELEDRLIAFAPIKAGKKQWLVLVWAPKEDAIKLIRSAFQIQLLVAGLSILIVVVGSGMLLVLPYRLKRMLEREVETKTGELQESHDRLFTVLNSIDAAVYVADIDSYEVLYENQPLKDLFGEVVGKKCWEIFRIGQSGPCEFCPNDQLLTATGEPAELITREHFNEVAGGWYHVYDRAIKWLDGRLVRLEIAFDVTERKQAEESLEESERRYRQIVEEASDIVYTTDFQGYFNYVNPPAQKFTGYSEEELIGMHFKDLIPVKSRNRVQLFYEKQFREHVRETTLEFPITTRAGDEKWVEQKVMLLRDGDQVAGFQSIMRDITERKQAEEALRESEEKYRTLVENVQDGIFVIQDQRMQFVNEAFARIIGYTVEEIIGMNFKKLVAPEDLEMVADRYRRRQAGEDIPSEYEFRMLHTDGKTRVYVNMNAGIFSYRGQVASIGTVRDITERKRAENALIRTNRALKLVSECTQALIREQDEIQLLDAICKIIVDIGGYRLAWVGMAEHDRQKTVRPVSWVGYEKGYLETAKITWADTKRGRGPTGTAIRTGEPVITRDISTDPLLAPWRKEALERGYASSIALPLKIAEQIIGALNIYSPEPDAFIDEEVYLLRELGDDLAYGIMALRAQVERKQAEEALRESEGMYKSLVNASPEAVTMSDMEGRIIYASPQTLELHGVAKAEDILGKSTLDLISPEDLQRAIENMEKTLKEGILRNVEYTFMRHDGSRFVGELSAAVIKDRSGNPSTFIATTRDITRRKRAEEASRKSELNLRIRNEIAEAFLTTTGDDTYHKVLQKILAASESKFGVFGYIDDEGALVCPSMTRDIWEQCQMVDKRVVFPRNSWGDSLWCRAIRDKTTLYSNEPSCVPEGHIPVDRNLAIPIIHEQEVIGLIHVTNKPTDYGEQDVELLEDIMSHVIAPVLYAQRLEEQQAQARKRAEDALGESKEYAQNLVASSLDMIIAVDNRRMITEFNDAAVDTFGYTREEVLGKHVNLLYADHKEGYKVHKKTIKHGRHAQEILNQRKNGKTFPCLLSSSILLDSSGNRVGVMGVSRDISKYKQREKVQAAIYQISEAAHAAQKLEQLYGALHEIVGELMPAMNFYIALYNAESGILEFPYFIDEHDQTPAPKKLGKGLTEYVLRTGKPLLASREGLDALVKSGEVEQIGTPPVEWLGVPLIDDDRSFGVIVVQSYSSGVRYSEEEQHILKFVSSQVAAAIQRVQAEEALRESEGRYRTVLEASPGPIFLLNRDGNVLDLDMPRKSEDRPEVLVTSYIHDYIYDEDQERFEHELQICLDTDSLREFEVRNLDQSLTYQILLAPIKTGRSPSETIVCNMYDITERKKLEADAIKAAKLESMEVFAAGLAHDFNNFLMSIMLNLSSMRLRLGEDPKIVELLKNAEESVQRAKSITRQLQTFTRQSGLEKSRRYFTPVLKEGLKFALRGTTVQPKFKFQDDLWPVELDSGQISQVIYNLAINASHAMPEGGNLLVTTANITISDKQSIGPLKPGQYIKVSFQDKGRGIPPEIQGQIFNPYFTTKVTGSGLGLFSVRKIIDNHGGWITVESKMNKGTTFVFYLPAVVGAVVEPYLQDTKLITGKGPILVIECDELNRKALTRLLEDLGFEAASATGSRAAQELLKEAQSVGKQFRAAIIDFIISGEMSGADSLKHIRRIDPKIKAIIMSGRTNMPIMTNYRDYGFQGRLIKPFAATELSAALNYIFAEE